MVAWTLHRDRLLRRALKEVSGLPEDVLLKTESSTIDDVIWGQCHTIYFGGEGVLLQDLSQRWNIVRKNTEFDLHEHEFKRKDDEDAVPEDILNAFNSAQGKKQMKQVAANLLNRDTVIALGNWRQNFLGDQSRFWQLGSSKLVLSPANVGVAVNPLALAASEEEEEEEYTDK